MKDAALHIFHLPPERYNCAQAVIHAYRTVSGDATYHPGDYRSLGGGRAPEGTCGALYAACEVCRDQAGELTAAFRERTGAVACRDLKGKGFPCAACVETAAGLLETALKK